MAPVAHLRAPNDEIRELADASWMQKVDAKVPGR
jgi:hypothetical protein